MLDVPSSFDERHQQPFHSQLQYRRAGAVDTAGLDLLYDLYRVEDRSRIYRLTRMMADDNPLALDVEKRTTRGRVCPRCGGKIIPSDRAVYQTGADPPDHFLCGNAKDVVMKK